MKVAICIPSTDEWRADFGMSVAGLLAYAARTPAPNGEPIELKIFNMRFAYVTYSRNCLFREALAWKADWILHIETDMLFPADALHELMAHDKDCVSLNVVHRRVKDGARGTQYAKAVESIPLVEKFAGLFRQVANLPTKKMAEAAAKAAQLAAMQGVNFTGMSRRLCEPIGLLPAPLVEVDNTSFCFVLVKADVLRKVPPPWAEFIGVVDINSRNCETTLEQEGHRQSFITDDYGFCRNLAQCGFKIHVDMRVSAQARHIGIARFGFNGMEIEEMMFTT